MMEDTKKRRRPSNDVLAAIKATEDRLREAAQEKLPPAKAEDNADKISYDQWWMTVNRKVKLRQHMKEVLLADFKARGASKMETEAKYDEFLRIFGYQW